MADSIRTTPLTGSLQMPKHHLDAPNRCRGSRRRRQCGRPAVEGQSYCITCLKIGKQQLMAEKRRQYDLELFRERHEHHADYEKAISLREEIGVLRLLLERVYNDCKDEKDLLAASGQISQLALNIEKLIKTAHAMDMKLGELLTKNAIVKLAGTIGEILVDELKEIEGHEELVDRITGRMAEAIEAANNSEED